MLQNPIHKENFKITKATYRSITPFCIPTPFQDASMGPFDKYTIGTLCLEDEHGYQGEVPMFQSVVPLVEKFLFPKLFTSSAINYKDLHFQLYWAIRNEGFRGTASNALGQLDLCLYDLAAKRNHKPLHRYLGAKYDWANVYACGGGTNLSLEALCEEAERYLSEGYEAFKIKVGKDFGGNIIEDIERTISVKEIIGTEKKLAVDANQIWSVAQTLSYLQDVGEELAWMEEPIHSASLEEIRTLCEKTEVPISYGESERSGKVFPTLVKYGVKHLQPIVGYLASLDEWFDVAKMAKEHQLFFSSGGFSQFNCSVVAAAGKDAYTEYLEPLNSSINQYLLYGPKIEDGKFFLQSEAGITAKINWEKVKMDGELEQEKSWTADDFVNVGAMVN